MTKDEYESLIASPGWDAMKRYLLEARAKLVEGVMDGAIQASARDEAIFRAQGLKDIAEMDWPTIAKFYDIPLEPEVTDAA